jgi:hypothetical protein
VAVTDLSAAGTDEGRADAPAESTAVAAADLMPPDETEADAVELYEAVQVVEGDAPNERLLVGERDAVELYELVGVVLGLAPKDSDGVALVVTDELNESEPDADGDAPNDSEAVAVTEADEVRESDEVGVTEIEGLDDTDTEPDGLGEAPVDGDGGGGAVHAKVSPAPDDTKPGEHVHVAGSFAAVPALETEFAGHRAQTPLVEL